MFRKINLAILAALVITSSATFAKKSSSRPASWATEIKAKGVDNFYKLNDGLYRGKQPSSEGFAELRKMGIKTIVNLREEDTDKDYVNGFNYVMIPMRAHDPKVEDIVSFLKVATDKTKQPIFVHCMRGADRTGYMCAMYRIVVEGWTKDAAIDEMVHGGYNFSMLICSNLVDFIKNVDVEQIKKEINLPQTAAK